MARPDSGDPPQRSAFLDELHELVRPSSARAAPAVLYHYTSAESFHKILQSRCLLATHFEFTNDPNELRQGLDLAVEVTKRTLEAHLHSWAEPMLTNVLGMLESGNLHAQTPNFVTCFSEFQDSLGQWRAYAQDGRGYAIGFDTKSWEFEKSNGSELGLVLAQCSYDEQRLTMELLGQQRLIIERGSRIDELSDAEELDIEKALLLSAAYACIRLKHAGFKDEAEWRLVALPHTATEKPDCQCVREVGGVFTPAVRVLLRPEGERLPLRRIMMGPYHSQEERKKTAEYGLRELLRLTGHHASSKGFIKRSAIPYRPRL